VSSFEIDEVLLGLKVAFLVLLYLFIWRIVRSASRDIRSPQESFVLAPSQAQAHGLGAAAAVPADARPPRPAGAGRLVVLESTALTRGETRQLESAVLTVGRNTGNDLALSGDGFASGSHARFEPRRDGVWLLDTGSTNGTYVNDRRLGEPRRLEPGDLVRIGETKLRYEA